MIEKKVPTYDDSVFEQAAEWIKNGITRLEELERKISEFKENFKRQADKISIAFEIEDADNYSIKAYASFTALKSRRKYYEINVEDLEKFPNLKDESEGFFVSQPFLAQENINIIEQSSKVKTRKKSKWILKNNPNNNNNILDEPQNNDVYQVSAGKYSFQVANFSMFSEYEQGKIEKALASTVDRVDPKTNMPRWLKKDSLGVQGVKRLAVMNKVDAEKGYSLKTNKYKMRLYGVEDGMNAEGQTVISFKYSPRFGH